MIEIRINKEIGNFDPRFVGPFTMRQALAVAVAAPICIVIFYFGSKVMPSDLAGFLCAPVAAAAAAFGWIKPYGMRMERFIQSIFINKLVAPTNRKYKTVNTHEQILKHLATEYEKLEREAEREASSAKKSFFGKSSAKKAASGSVTKSDKKAAKAKYKVSPEAIR